MSEYKTVVKVQGSAAAERLVDSGVLYRCVVCGQIFDSSHKRGVYCSPGCYERGSAARDNRMGRVYRASRRFNPGQLKWAAEVKERMAGRFMDNMIRLMVYLGGEGGDGGARCWFMVGDVIGLGILEDVWLSANNYYNWRVMVGRLVDIGMLEVRKVGAGKGSGKGIRSYNEYRFVKGF